MDYALPISEFEGEIFVTEFSLSDKELIFQQDNKKFLAFAPIRFQDKGELFEQLSLVLDGVITTQGIFKSTKFETQPPSLGIDLGQLPNGADASDIFTRMEAQLAKDTPGYRVTSVVKNGGMFLKLKTKKDADEFDFDCDIPISPSLIKEAGLVKDQIIKIAVEIFTYYNVKDKTCGLVLKVLEIQTAFPPRNTPTHLLNPRPIITPPNTPITISNAPGTFFGSRPNTPPQMQRRKSMVPKRLDFSQRN